MSGYCRAFVISAFYMAVNVKCCFMIRLNESVKGSTMFEGVLLKFLVL